VQTCLFQPALFLASSRLALLAVAPAFLQPRFFRSLPVIDWRTVCQNRGGASLFVSVTGSLTPVIAEIRRTAVPAALPDGKVFFTLLLFVEFLRFPRRGWPFTTAFVVGYPDFAATVADFLCPFIYAG